MRVLLLLLLTAQTLLALNLGSILGSISGTSNTCSSVGPLCTKFLTKLLGMLTNQFTPQDQIVCQIGSDVGTAVASNQKINGIVTSRSQLPSTSISALSSKATGYITTLTLTKANLVSYVTSFGSCLSGISGELGMIDFLKKTVGAAAVAKLALPFKKKITPKITKMTQNNKNSSEMVEESCDMGVSICTADLVSNIIKKTMKLTYTETWETCIMNNIVKNGLLSIGKFVKSSYKTKKTCPSG